jgi:SpoVK/Ycf46/Vps4 family AAA+-type ATPase
MGATNRPFDLDDAILRRMPQRLLSKLPGSFISIHIWFKWFIVDLPSAKDRVTILRLHLAGEQLDESVDLDKLAQLTDFYSGSDLKNLCIMAAIYAVQDFNLASTPPTSRVLRYSHFDRAMKEVRATLNSEMQTLQDLRKWNDTYGQTSFGKTGRIKHQFGF